MPDAPPDSFDFDSLRVVPYWTEVRIPLFEAITTIENKVERDLRGELEARAVGLRLWSVSHLRVARHTYEVIETLANDRKKLALGLEIAVVVPPLARVILESAFSLTYIYEDAATRLPQFWKGAWKKIAQKCDEYQTAYGSDPRWQQYLPLLRAQRDGWVQQLAASGTPLTPQQLADWRTVPGWPNPGKMPSRCTSPWRRTALSYLDARYYGPLSVATHLSGPGMFEQAGHVLRDRDEGYQRKYFSDQYMTAFTMLLSLLSVFALDVIGEPGFAQRIVALWQSRNLPDATVEVFTECFRDQLTGLADGAR
jgi:hypothetical protein